MEVANWPKPLSHTHMVSGAGGVLKGDRNSSESDAKVQLEDRGVLG